MSQEHFLGILFQRLVRVYTMVIEEKRNRREVEILLQSVLDSSADKRTNSLVMLSRLVAVLPLIKGPEEQIEAWRKADEKGQLGISSVIPSNVPVLTEQDLKDGFVGVGLFYGFGEEDDCSDMILSAKVVWDYAREFGILSSAQERERDFDSDNRIKTHHEAHPRPQGFYWMKIGPGLAYHDIPVPVAREDILQRGDWGMGPEGIQFLTITHPDYTEKIKGGFQIPYMGLAEFVIQGRGITPLVPLLGPYSGVGDGKLYLGGMQEGLDSRYDTAGIGSLRP